MDETVVQDAALLEGLTEPQVQAVTHVDGPLLVLAGPGSGKTRVITRRIAYLVREVGIPPWNVLAITFTNKAAGEMRDRVAQLVTERQARAITVATFHSLCARLIRRYADRMGLPPGYSIYDTADQKRAIKQALEDLEINTKNFPPASMLGAISNAKNDLLDAKSYAAQASNFYDRTVAKVYTKYTQILERNAAVDFDDLLLKTVQLLKKHADVLAELRERYQYVLIDEYQDTNHAQFMIANALSREHTNIMSTGDPDQSIYGWRGADIRNILEFEQHYPDATIVRLEQNYRSTKQILAAADALIANNRARKHKTLWTDNEAGEPIRVVTCADEKHEARWVVEQYQELNKNGVPWAAMAVFYRINSLSRVMEETLRDAGVPYQIARGTAFYDRKEIKDSIAYLRTIANPADEVNLFRVINTPARGISAATVKAIQAQALATHTSADALLGEPMSLTAINTRAQTAVAKFGKLLHGWRETAGMNSTPPPSDGDNTDEQLSLANDVSPTDPTHKEIKTASGGEPSLRSFVEDVLRDSGLEAYYRNDKSDPDQERLANLGELVTSAQQFEEEYAFEFEQDNLNNPDAQPPSLREKLLAYLERVALVSDADAVDPEQGAVTLMTLHAAKGLEFHAVSILGVEDGMLPHDRANGDDQELEEERRLAFVGITRAERWLALLHAKYRTVFGQTMPTIRSRFLGELPEDTLQQEDPSQEEDAFEDPRYRGGGSAQRSKAAREAGRYPPGTMVKHPQFGVGRVVQVSPMGAHTRAKIDFTTAGTKTLILQYARLEVLT
jgi:DNA helicase-2/ATP-dependent DNA helicase PcrA